MDPFSLALLLGAQAAIGIFGAVSEGDQNRKDAQENQKLANAAATDAIERGNQQAGRIRLQAGQLLARQKVAYAANGVDPTSGTAARVQAGTRSETELDASLTENNAARDAFGFKRYGKKYGQQADLETPKTVSKVAGTILGGAGQALDYYARYGGKT